MIKINNLSYSVKNLNNEKKDILKNLSINFLPGKITAITGSNGSGKSTLIKAIMGILKPDYGTIFFKDINITDFSITERAKLGISVAFQQPITFKGIKIKQLLEVAGAKSFNDMCLCLSKVGLCAKDYIDRYYDSNLSGGEAKRIELAMCLAKNGEVFLFDEPEAGIDLWSVDNLVSLIKNLKDKTIIIVSHQQKILEIADEILILNDNGYEIGPQNIMLNKIKPIQTCGVLGDQK